ncbi:MAG TPA: universal stress protein [Bryobacteraceae bacterium]|nr:universal stress protein [Bryobacteraceae bacterium]
MLNLKHILFPLDFSSRCCAAVPYIEAMAVRFGAKITVLSVAQPFFYAGMGDPGGPVMVDSDEVLRELKERLDGALVKEFARVPVDRVAEIGDPAQVIVSFARSQNADLIMMPTHGYGPFRGLLLGSVTAKVLHDAECAVWTAAHMEDPPAREHLSTRAVLCAVDGTAKSVELMKYAAELAAACGATLRLAHVIPGIESWPARQADRDFEEQMRLEARRTVEGLQKAAGIDAPLCVAVGNIAEGVREEARRHGADLIVIGRGVLHETLGRLRTHAYGIIRHSPCPVISV